MRDDDKDDEFLEDDDGFEEGDEATLQENTPDKASKGMDARRKLELLREQKELRKLLGEDFDFPLDDEF